MEIITIEKQTYEDMLVNIEQISSQIDTIYERINDKALKQWIDSQDVCNILRITKRQLQTYRENGTLGFSKIGNKIYYRPQDIQQLILTYTHENNV